MSDDYIKERLRARKREEYHRNKNKTPRQAPTDSQTVDAIRVRLNRQWAAIEKKSRELMQQDDSWNPGDVVPVIIERGSCKYCPFINRCIMGIEVAHETVAKSDDHYFPGSLPLVACEPDSPLRADWLQWRDRRGGKTYVGE